MKKIFGIFLSLIVYVLIMLGEKTKNIESVISILYKIVLEFLPIQLVISIVLRIIISNTIIVQVLSTLIASYTNENVSNFINGKIKKIKKNAPTYSKDIIAIFTVRRSPIQENSNTECKVETFTFNNNIIGKIVIYINNK